MTGGIMDKILMQNGTFTKKLVVFYVAQIILAL
jgi:phage-related holin